MKMKGLFSLIFVFVPLYVFASCPDPPKGIPNNPLGEGFAFAFPSVVALEGNETRPAVFYKVHQTDIVEIYDPFGVLVKRFEPGDRNEVISGRYANVPTNGMGKVERVSPYPREYISRFLGFKRVGLSAEARVGNMCWLRCHQN
jgi:hypothetical protein